MSLGEKFGMVNFQEPKLPWARIVGKHKLVSLERMVEFGDEPHWLIELPDGETTYVPESSVVVLEENEVSGSCFEMVDTTSEETYFTIGMFPSLADALAALDKVDPEDMPGAHYEYDDLCRVEVRERKWGWGGLGLTVSVREWTTEYNEEKDEYVWVRKEIK